MIRGEVIQARWTYDSFLEATLGDAVQDISRRDLRNRLISGQFFIR
jgi:hypothetical protein